MERRFIRLLPTILCMMVFASQAQSTEETRIDSVTRAFYEHLSYFNNQVDKMKDVTAVMTSDAVLIANYGDTPQRWTIDAFVPFLIDVAAKQKVTDRTEKELFAKTYIFGTVAQRFSAYQLDFTADGKKISRRGVNSFQLLRVAGQWKIFSVTWDTERSGQSVPKSFD
jgi:hypothetical protein